MLIRGKIYTKQPPLKSDQFLEQVYQLKWQDVIRCVFFFGHGGFGFGTEIYLNSVDCTVVK